MSERFTGVEIRWSPVGAAPGMAGGSARFPVGAVVAIGRDSDNDIVLPDQEVSRKHARLVVRGSDVTFTDLRTSNGSRIDGRRRLGTARWQPGQILQLGNHLLEIELVVEVPNAMVAMTVPLYGAHSQLHSRFPDKRDHTPDAAGSAPDMAAPSVAATAAGPASSANETSTEGQVATDFENSTKYPERDRAVAETATVACIPTQGLALQDAGQRERPPEPASEISAPAVAVAKPIQPPDATQAGTVRLKSAGSVPAEPDTSEIADPTDAATDAPVVARVNAASETPDPPAPLGLVPGSHAMAGLQTATETNQAPNTAMQCLPIGGSLSPIQLPFSSMNRVKGQSVRTRLWRPNRTRHLTELSKGVGTTAYDRLGVDRCLRSSYRFACCYS
jgi:pSer/pThr/pTyr-binding forkhead associated (FHA) protein